MGIFSGLFKSRDKPENYVQGAPIAFSLAIPQAVKP